MTSTRRTPVLTSGSAVARLLTFATIVEIRGFAGLVRSRGGVAPAYHPPKVDPFIEAAIKYIEHCIAEGTPSLSFDELERLLALFRNLREDHARGHDHASERLEDLDLLDLLLTDAQANAAAPTADERILLREYIDGISRAGDVIHPSTYAFDRLLPFQRWLRCADPAELTRVFTGLNSEIRDNTIIFELIAGFLDLCDAAARENRPITLGDDEALGRTHLLALCLFLDSGTPMHERDDEPE